MNIDSLQPQPPAGLYNATSTATGIAGLAAFSQADKEFFAQNGYLVVEKAFDTSEVQTALQGIHAIVSGAYPDFQGLQFEAQAQDRLEQIKPEERQDWVRRLMGFVNIEPRLAEMANHPALHKVLQALLEDTPVLMQDMALLKPPRIGREKPWHQDNAFFDISHQNTVIGVWIALDQAIPENGCMHIIPGSHLEGPKIHFQRRDFQLCDTDVAVQEVMAVPLEPGGALLFHSLLHHGTPPSQSNKRRRAVQYHYRPSQAQMVSAEQRLAVFGSEGKDAQC